MCRRGDLSAVDVEAEGCAVVGLGQVRPAVGGERGGPEGIGVAAAGDRARVRPRGVGRGRLEVEVVVALVDHVTPVGVDGRGVDPRLERHPAREVQRGRVGDRDERACAVELQRLAVFAGRRPGRRRDRARVTVPRRVRDRRPRALIKAVSRDQAVRDSGGAGAGDVRIAAQVAGGVAGADAVAVAGGRADAGVFVARAGGGGDLGEVAATAALAAFELVAADGDVVARGPPGKVNLAATNCSRRQRPRLRRRLRVGCGGGGAGDVRVAAQVGAVAGADPVAVAGGGADAGVFVARAGGGGDLGEVAAAAALAAFELVAADADVVARGPPGEVDLAAADRGRRQRPRLRRRLRVRTVVHRRRLIGLDLGGGERDVVDADLVDQAGEELPIDAVATDL